MLTRTGTLCKLSRWFIGLFVFLLHVESRAAAPSIVYILADDLGYGDVRCLNPESKITTPHIDRLASQGMLFSDAHSGSSVCTPTRYGILTGRYAWRTTLERGVLGGYSPALIEKGRLTVPGLLRKHGYHSACIGKWHLGMGWSLKNGGQASKDADAWQVDYARPIVDGPTTVGFDKFFGISASLDMPPYLWIENDRTRGVPTVEKTWIRKGPAHQDFEAIDVLPELTRQAVSYLEERARPTNKGRPFFLYLPLTSPHTPILPAREWQNKSKLTPYGDFVMQTDATVGAVLTALDRLGLAERTMVIVTSDNGCSPAAGIARLLEKGHRPSAQFRGHKADIYEGGHRIPLVVRWPGRVKPGTTCDHTVCLTDLLATCAEILGVTLPANAGEDSVSLVPALEGKATPVRTATVHHSINGSFAIRQGKWKLCLCPDSGGWSEPRPGKKSAALPPVQLFDLALDPGETTNLAEKHPEIVDRLRKLLEHYQRTGRSVALASSSSRGGHLVRVR